MKKMQTAAIGRRATFRKAGCPDIKVEVSAMQGGGAFTVTENGESSATWPRYTPQQLMNGDTPPMTLDDVWRRLREQRYSDYAVTDEEILRWGPK
jgi:hypothetical protein